ncbi:uncharacterized protein UTRI_10302 [Ustilago trichophora]|uniref:F-box domain-containing protein n=1 Tax=Ustilago trichophora TaxID=86804 RepID=A0A5C3EPI3_9BASI|nr:uncharacterized protein UTRI_10302 [Ustilago trichophora]
MGPETSTRLLNLLYNHESVVFDATNPNQDHRTVAQIFATARELESFSQQQDALRGTLNRNFPRSRDDRLNERQTRHRDHLKHQLDVMASLRTSIYHRQTDLEDSLHNPRSRMDTSVQDASKLSGAVEIAARTSLSSFSMTVQEPATLQQAWAQNDFEKVVEFASDAIEEFAQAPARRDHDGIRQLCAGLWWRFKAYQSMRLFSLAVSDANRAFELLVQLGFDMRDGSGLLPANTSESRLQEQSGQRTLKRLASNDSIIAAKRPRHDTQTEASIPAAFHNLSLESILAIADYLDPADCTSLRNTCRGVRRIPQMWQYLVFVRIKKTLRSGWHRDTIQACVDAIDTCQRRSHGGLRSVILKGLILSADLPTIFEALRPSLQKLFHLAIPTLDQKRCYQDLYQHCPGLASIDIRINHQDVPDSAAERLLSAQCTSSFPSSQMPYKLRYFYASPEFHCGDLTPHMAHLEVATGVKSSCQESRNLVTALISAAGTLREWVESPGVRWGDDQVDIDDYGVYNQTRTATVFPCLVKLSAMWSEHLNECEFPALEELSINAHRRVVGAGTRQAYVARARDMILQTPTLKRLDVLLPFDCDSQRSIMEAIAELKHLEELNIWTRYCGITLQPWIDRQGGSSDTTATGHLLWPALHTLGIFMQTVPLSSDKHLERQLCEFLLLRFFLQKGCTPGELKNRTGAALAAYDKSSHKLNKTQKKKLLAEAAAAAAASNYPGRFQTQGDIKQEIFSPVLSKLVSNPETRGEMESTMPNALLDQLVGNYVEMSIDENLPSQRPRYPTWI